MIYQRVMINGVEVTDPYAARAILDLQLDGNRLRADLDALRTRIAEVEKDAARWGFIRKKWKTVNLRFKKRPNVLAGFTLTVSMENNHSDAYYLEKEIDAAISGETNGQN